MNYIETLDAATNSILKIHYTDQGKGTPVVFIHGWPLSNEMWEYQVNELAQKGMRCIAYDRRGFGKSSKPWESYHYDAFADDLKALLDKLNLENATLVGFSMGGGEIARYFKKYGGARVSKAVLLGAVTPYLLKDHSNPNGIDAETFLGMQNGIREDRINFLNDFGKTFFGVNVIKHPVSAPLLEYYRMLGSFALPKATLDCVDAFSKTDFRQDLLAINVPTLIIHGDADKIVPLEISGNLTAQSLPHAKFVVYEDAPHGFFYTHRKRLNKDLLEFILQKS